MALFTKLFNRDAQPYDLKGRWYRAIIKNGNVVDADWPVGTTTAGYLTILGPQSIDRYHLADYFYVAKFKVPSSNYTHSKGIRLSTSNYLYIAIPNINTAVDEITVYFYLTPSIS